MNQNDVPSHLHFDPWNDINNPNTPKDGRIILLWGTLILNPDVYPDHNYYPKNKMVVTGYWEPIDEAWAITNTPYYGPFFEPEKWAYMYQLPKELNNAL